MDAQTQFVHQGVWQDYSRPFWNRYQWTLTETTAQAMTNLIAICLALALSRVPILFKPLMESDKESEAEAPTSHPRTEISDGTSMEDPLPHPTIAAIAPAHVAGDEHGHVEERTRPMFPFDSIEDGLTRAGEAIFGGRVEIGTSDKGIRKFARQIAANAREDTWHFSLALVFAASLVALFFLEQTLAILSANIVTGSKVLSAHPDCGLWGVNFDAYNSTNSSENYEAMFHNFKAERAKQVRALNYAEKCYGGSDGTENCNFLASRSISYDVMENAQCPFAGDVCFNGPSSAISMDTGFQPAAVIGINAPGSGFFRRRAICAPITTRAPYFRQRFLNSSWTSVRWEYLYGWPGLEPDKEKEPVLWTQTLSNSATAGAYHLDVYGSTGLDVPGGFSPAPEFQVSNATVSLFFLQSKDILYSSPRRDPMFPTTFNHTSHQGNISHTFYFNNYPTATVLGCADFYEACVPDMSVCYNMSTREQSNSSSAYKDQEQFNLRNKFYPSIIFYTALSYFHSNSYWTNSNLEARGLDASGKVMFGAISLGLDEDQWKIEAQKIFNVSLSRLQLNTMAVARGEKIGGNAREYNAIDIFENWDLTPLCRLVKIEGVGWKNISLFWFVSLLFLSTCLAVGSVEVAEVSISVRAWRGIRSAVTLISTTILVPLGRKLASIRWRALFVTLGHWIARGARRTSSTFGRPSRSRENAPARIMLQDEDDRAA